MQAQAGTVDFYPNGGVRQPGCESDPLNENICSHTRAWEFFQASVTRPKSFPAIRCASYDDFLTQDKGGKCWTDDINYLGFGALEKYENFDFLFKFAELLVSFSATGKYYLQTNENVFTPARGMDGIKPFIIPAPRGLDLRDH